MWHYRTTVQSQEADINDLMECYAHFGEAGDVEQSDNIAQYAASILDLIGRWDDERKLANRQLQNTHLNKARQSVWYHRLGALAQDQGDYVAAQNQYQRALTIFEALGDQTDIANTHHDLGVLAQLQGDYGAARDLYERSLHIKEQLGDQAGMVAIYNNLGTLAQARGDSPSIILYFLERSLECTESIPATMQTIKIVISIGVHALQVDAVELAIRAFFWLLHTALTNADQTTKAFGVAIAGFRELYQSGYSAEVDSALAPLLAELPPESAQQLQSLIETDDGDRD